MCFTKSHKKSDKKSNLRGLRKILSNEEWIVLLNDMCLECERTSANNGEDEEDFIRKVKSILPNRTWIGNANEIVEKNVGIKSNAESGCNSKSNFNKDEERNSRCNKVLPWWKWKVLCSSDYFVQFLEGTLGCCVRTSDKNGCDEGNETRVSDELQGGYCYTKSKDSNRGRWSVAQFTKESPKGLEENCEVSRIGVESVEIYKRGSEYESKWSWLTDTDIRKGFVYFYDLDVRFAHNYFVDGLLVHNCHKLTNDAQNALLKITEEPPEYCYFVLCTTDPQKLIKPLKTRCSQIEFKPLDNDTMVRLLRRVSRRERQNVSDDVLLKIAEQSEGSSRDAIKRLSAVLYMSSDEERVAFLNKNGSTADEDAIILPRTLMHTGNWDKIAPVLTQIKDDIASNPEGVRQLCMSYAQSILLKGYNFNAEAMIQCFSNQDTYRNGKYAITVATLDYCNTINSR